MGKPLREIVAENIRKYRAEAGLTQKELGEAAKITPVHINKIEMTGRNISLDTLEAIANALEVPVTTLMENSKFYPPKSKEKLRKSIKDTMMILEAYLSPLDDKK